MSAGNIAEDATVTIPWSTNGADGASITRGTDGTVAVYKLGSTTESTAGVTDSEDYDGKTGCHLVTIDTSADAFYETGKDYNVMLQGAVIDGKTVNRWIGSFQIQNRYAGSGSGLDAAGVRAAVGLASANLDTQLAAIDDYLDSEIAAGLTILNKLDDTLEDDAGTYRFTANSLEEAPTGGGGGGDWTADQLAALITILGVPASGTTPETPTAGVLKLILDAATAIKERTDNLPDDPADASDLDAALDLIANAIASIAVPSASDNATALLDLANGIETGVTPRQAIRAIAAVIVGVLSGAGTSSLTFKGINVATTRVQATVTSAGNRTTITLSLT